MHTCEICPGDRLLYRVNKQALNPHCLSYTWYYCHKEVNARIGNVGSLRCYTINKESALKPMVPLEIFPHNPQAP